VLDPDVGGMSYDSGLQVIDLFGLGDVAIARTHPVDEPGMREAIFSERRPTFVHLHGAWYGAVNLERLEELEQPTFASRPSSTTATTTRATTCAATTSPPRGPRPPSSAPPSQAAAPPGRTDTPSARGTDPDRPVVVELTFAQPSRPARRA
jgi:hypothetical protein